MTVVATIQREHERERERELAQACEVCKTIVSVASARFEDTAHGVLGKVSNVLQGECPHVESLPRAVQLPEPLAEYADREIMARKEKDMTTVHFVIAEVKDEDENVLQEAEQSLGVELLHRPDVPDHAGRGLIVDRQWVRWENVLRWVGKCHSSHKQKCQQPRWFAGLPRAVPEWLIDVWNLCLVHQPTAGDASTYAALSYSRGGCESLKTSRRIIAWLMRPGALAVEFFASRIPETFRNAIDVTKCLGQRYLWVDALCIMHDDIDSVSKALGEMNLIIASASITIVALTGQGLDFGLRGVPGMSQPRDLKMEVCGLSNGERLITNPVDDDEVSEHSYQNRAWTYPEWLLSRRRLIFRPGSVEWLCQCASWKEHLIHHEQSDAVWRGCLERCEITGHVLKRSPSIWDYSHLTSLFNARMLPTPSDAAKAFSAIQLMMDTVHPGGMNLGLSEFWFEVQLAWSSLGADMERRVADKPAYSPLCALPSWSWLGWQGPVTWPVDCDFQITGQRQTRDQRVGFRRPVTSFSSLSSLADTSTLRPIHSAWLPFRDRVDVAEDRELASAQSGWYMERYDRDLYPYDFNPRGRTLRRVFLNNFRPEKKYKYPVQRKSHFSVATPSRQDPFLVAEMMKVRFQLTDEMLIWSDRDHGRRIRIKETKGGPTVLSLTLPNMRTVESFLNPSTRPATLELIAFAQGWSTWLGDSYNVGTDILWGAEAGCSNQALRILT
jgi:hypothetical protein